MKPMGSSNDDQRPIREALQHDAARVNEEPFNAELHYAAMRRIRALTDARQPRFAWRWLSAAATGAVALILGLLAAPWRPQLSPRRIVHPETPTVVMSEPASAWAYQAAANRGDEALLAMLDRDAQFLLPRTASPFSTPLH